MSSSAKSASQAQTLHPTVKIAGVVSFFTDFSTQMVGPLLPLFLTSVLGGPVWVYGLMEGVGAGIAGRSDPLFLYTSDLSRRFSYYCSLFLNAEVFCLVSVGLTVAFRTFSLVS